MITIECPDCAGGHYCDDNGIPDRESTCLTCYGSGTLEYEPRPEDGETAEESEDDR